MSYNNDLWILIFKNFDANKIGLWETLCTLGNGYFSIRGADEEARADSIHYPATYLAGGYNTLKSEIEGHVLNNEDFVNFPNGLLLRAYPENESRSWIDNTSLLYDYQLKLIMLKGILYRKIKYIDPQGRKFQIISARLVSMNNPHLAAIQYHIKPLNYSGNFVISSGLDGNVENAGVKRYAQLNHLHIKVISREKIAHNEILLLVQTIHSNIQFVLAARTSIFIDDQPLHLIPKTYLSPKAINQEFSVFLKKDQSVRIEKIISVHSSKDFAIKSLRSAARTSLLKAGQFKILEKNQHAAWLQLWKHYDIELGTTPKEQQLIRFNIFHLLQTISYHSINRDYGIPARGLHGEAYRGHIFWDELFILPFFINHSPEIARSLLLYRYRRLEAAKCLAQALGYKGAKYPWQSASSGEEVSQQWHLNPYSKRWDPDYSSLQYHINSAIAYNIWQYYLHTHDVEFISTYGAIMILEIARFWASIAIFNPITRRYDINAVMGPDEYHEKYPETEKPGINNNAYTNIMAVWTLERALEILKLLPVSRVIELKRILHIKTSELNRWISITRRIFIPFHDGVISQFEGYEKLKEFDWNGYKKKYGNIERLDRILKNENDSPDKYKIAKQADVVMLFYLFPKKTLKNLFDKINYFLDDKIIQRTIDYYLNRTSHGSTLSKIIYSSVLIENNPILAREYYLQALESDVYKKNETTHEGIHLGVMAGTLTYVMKHYLGLNIEGKLLSFTPKLPNNINHLKVRFQYCFKEYYIYLNKKIFSITLESNSRLQSIMINNKLIKIKYNVSTEFKLI